MLIPAYPLSYGKIVAVLFAFFFFNDTATTEIYTLSLHDALPISSGRCRPDSVFAFCQRRRIQFRRRLYLSADRKSTRLNSSHQIISYAVFCLKKKKGKTVVCLWLVFAWW